MNAEFFGALEQLEKEKGIPQVYMLENIQLALAAAFKKEYGNDVLMRVELDPVKKKMRVFLRKEIVETVENPTCQVSLEEARARNSHYEIGQFMETEIKTDSMHRLSASAAKAIIIQSIRVGERHAMQAAYENRKEELITATVSKVDHETGNVLLELDRGVNVLYKVDQIPGETFTADQKVKVLLTEINKESRGPVVSLSRVHPKLVWRLFELEIPEIQDGTVIIKGVSREAGSRTKIAVYSRDPAVDAVGACIGTHNMRIDAILNELAGEKIDIVKYSETPEEYIAAALAPATVLSVTAVAERSYKVIVEPDQLSLAIGRKGQNACLAARLTGCKVDIKDIYGNPQNSKDEDKQRARKASV